MSSNDNGSARHDFEDATTGEHPVLAAPIADESPTTEVASLGQAPEQEPPVVLGLQHLESEIARLHDRWREVEQQFSVKDALVAELRGEIDARTAAATELEQELERSAAGLKAVENALVGKHTEVAKLTADLTARAQALADTEVMLAATAAEHAAAQRALEVARAEIGRLSAAVQREHAAAGAAAARSEELVATHGALKQRIQELEDYIDGRANSWSSLQAEVADQKAAILRLEKSLKTQELAVEDVERQKRTLATELAELARQNTELDAQRKEREAAYRTLERQLGDSRAAHSRLQAEIAERRTEHDRLAAKHNQDRALVASLEAELARRAETLSASEQELTAARTQIGELNAAKESLATLLAQQTDLTARLTSELAQKQAGLDVLNRSVRRISDLGASVAELERRFGNGPRLAANVAATADEHEADGEDLLPAETFLAAELEEAAQAGTARRTNGGARKLVGTIGGEAIDYALGKSEMTIGRGKTSDIRIQSHYISRHHARISTRGIATTIEDVGSKNGILVNQEKVKRAVLRDGDVVTLASELEFKFVDARH